MPLAAPVAAPVVSPKLYVHVQIPPLITVLLTPRSGTSQHTNLATVLGAHWLLCWSHNTASCCLLPCFCVGPASLGKCSCSFFPGFCCICTMKHQPCSMASVFCAERALMRRTDLDDNWKCVCDRTWRSFPLQFVPVEAPPPAFLLVPESPSLSPPITSGAGESSPVQVSAVGPTALLESHRRYCSCCRGEDPSA